MKINFHSSQPIGIFDSGVGGLTVAKELVQELPKENIIYFGDTAHFPYGEKSVEAIQSYALRITDIFLKKNVKLILIACGTASSVAFEVIKEKVGNQALVVNVIDPMVEFLRHHYSGKKVGLIATKRTVAAQVYKNKMSSFCDFRALAAPLLVTAVEEGLIEHKIIDDILGLYLNNASLQGIEALILACTHFPFVKKNIDDFYQHKIRVLDPSKVVALAVKEILEQHGLVNVGEKIINKFYVSDDSEFFVSASKRFFAESILERWPLNE